MSFVNYHLIYFQFEENSLQIFYLSITFVFYNSPFLEVVNIWLYFLYCQEQLKLGLVLETISPTHHQQSVSPTYSHVFLLFFFLLLFQQTLHSHDCCVTRRRLQKMFIYVYSADEQLSSLRSDTLLVYVSQVNAVAHSTSCRTKHLFMLMSWSEERNLSKETQCPQMNVKQIKRCPVSKKRQEKFWIFNRR